MGFGDFVTRRVAPVVLRRRIRGSVSVAGSWSFFEDAGLGVFVRASVYESGGWQKVIGDLSQRYNDEWLIEGQGYRLPAEMCRRFTLWAT
ncbi:MAG: hypothetical protein KatS3mg081_0340 [Gemmatimonadales bacterium]|nr:MAG: hypothetical protein KatS3mg081_0340 [Gemmatimonadales bacterium]